MNEAPAPTPRILRSSLLLLLLPTYIHTCTIQFNTHNWSSTLILSLLSTKSFLYLLTFATTTTTTTHRRRHCSFAHQTKKEHKCANPSKKDNSFGAFFLFFLVFRQPITNLVSRGSKCRSSSAALFAFLSAAIAFRVGTRTDTTSSRTRRREEAWPPTSDESGGSAQLATTVRAGAGSTARSLFFFLFMGTARSLNQ